VIMADVFKIVFLVVGTLVVLVSYWLAATALFPDAVRRARAQYSSRAVRITAVGLVVGIPIFILGAALVTQAPNPILKLAGGFIAAGPVLIGLLGSAGLSERIGIGLATADDERHPWRRTLRGGVVLSLTFLLPLVGWFIVLPWTVVSGFGAAIGALRSRERRPADAPVTAPAA
jgi:hypothetical protein